jgi:hypothetical protein
MAPRLALDMVAAALLLFGFAYWWLGNTAHELAGFALFAIIAVHNVVHRRWYRRIDRLRRDGRGVVDVAATLLFAAIMLVLLATSLLISNLLAPVAPLTGGPSAVQVHILVAYWALVLLAVHLGLRWPLVMQAGRTFSGTGRPSRLRTWLLRAAALLLVVQGLRSFAALDIGSRLTMRTTLDWWNFEEAVVGFFLHEIAVLGLFAVLAYYAMAALRVQRRFQRSR